MNKKKGFCVSCGSERYIYAKKMCSFCYAEEQRKKSFQKLRQLGAKWNSSQKVNSDEKTEREIFDEIWSERPHVSEISGEKLIEDRNSKFFYNQFLHILPKSIFNRFRTRKDNIMLGTVSEHHEQTTHPNMTKKDKMWNKFWDKYNELRIEYHSGKKI